MRLTESPSSNLAVTSRKTLSGLFAEFDTPNKNERVYPRSIYEPALQKIIPMVKEGRLLGECDHPADYDEVRLGNVSHVIRDCFVKDNKVYGSVEVLDTPSGKIVQALMEAGIPIGISSRGVGNTKTISDGLSEVTDFTLITFDLVAEPSFSNAFLTESAKVKIMSRFNSIEKELPLNESAGDSSIRVTLNTLRNKVQEAPDMMDTLIESMGSLSIKYDNDRKILEETALRNKRLKKTMEDLQESYNNLKRTSDTLMEEYSFYKKTSEAAMSELKRTTESTIKTLKENYDSEILELKKKLAIEKRGLSESQVMPMLEGITTEEGIESKLNYFTTINTRSYPILTKENLTEVSSSPRRDATSRLSKIVSSI